jgi:hypothetical protein
MATTIINSSQFPIADALWTLINSQPANVQDDLEKRFLERRRSAAAKKVSATKKSGVDSHRSFLNFLDNIPLKGAHIPGDEDGKLALVDERDMLL